MAGWPLLMLTLRYNLQGHLQLALWGQGEPGQEHKGSAPWLGEEPEVKVTLRFFLKSDNRVI